MKIIKDSKTEVFESIEPVEDRFFFNCNWLNILCKTGLTCLRCSDITEPRLCTKIERCQDGEVILKIKTPFKKRKTLKVIPRILTSVFLPEQVCAVQQYRADNGDIGYWTGCYPRQVRQLSNKVLHFHKMDIAFYNLPNSEDMYLSIFCWYVLWSLRFWVIECIVFIYLFIGFCVVISLGMCHRW